MGFFKRIKERKPFRKAISDVAHPITFEMLEPRLMLSADLSLTALVGQSLDLTLQLETGRQELQIIDNTNQSVLQSQPLAETRAVIITGADQEDKLTIDFTTPFTLPEGITFEDSSASDNNTLKVVGKANVFNITGENKGNVNGAGVINFAGIKNLIGGADADTFKLTTAGSISGDIDGGAGGDTLWGPEADTTWNITGEDAGNIKGVAFRGIGKLLGAANNKDTFVFAPAGTISGTIDGGFSGFDAIEVQNSSYDVVMFTYTGFGSGNIDLDGAFAFSYSMMETITLISSGRAPPTAVTINIPTVVSDEFTLRGDDTINGIITIDSTNGTLVDTTFEAPTGSLTVNSGQGSDIITVEVLEPGFDLFINGQAGNDTLIGPDIDSTWNITGIDCGSVAGAIFTDIENLIGGTGADIFVFANGSQISGVIDGGWGTNTLDYSDYTTDVAVDLYIGAATGTGEVSNIQNVTGGAGNDSLIGDEAANSLIGGPGDDVLTGGQGGDTLDGGEGVDTVAETRDADFTLTDAALTIGMEDPDALWGVEQAIITGGASQNTADASEFSGLLTFTGGEDNDTLIVGLGRNSFDGGPGNDTLTAGDRANLWEITGQDAGRLNGDVFTGVETLLGGAVADTFVILAAVALISKLINGRSGDDELKGNDGVNLWNITSENAGMLNSQAFVDIECLIGGEDTDNFVFTDAGSIGIVDGGGGQYDTMEVQGGIYQEMILNYVGSDSGDIELDRGIISSYSRMETIIVTSSGRGPPTTATINVLTGVSDEFILRGESTPVNEIITIHNTNGTFADTTFEAPTGSLTINSGQGNDTIAVEVLKPSFDLFINGQAGNDTLIGPDTDSTWNIMGIDSGEVGGITFTDIENLTGGAGSDILVGPSWDSVWEITGTDSGNVEGYNFEGIENLTGAAYNEDTFIIYESGSISGVIEGGDGGFDSLIINGGNYNTVTCIATGSDSGTIDLDGKVITYSGLEPITDSSTSVNRIYSVSSTPPGSTGSSDIIKLKDHPDSGKMILESVNGTFEDMTFNVPSNSLTLNTEGGNDTITVESFDSGFNADLIINAGDDIDSISLNVVNGSGTFTINGGDGDDDITIGNIYGSAATVTIDGGANDDTYFFSSDWGAVTINDSAGNDTLDFSGYTGILTISPNGLTITGDNGGTISTITVVGSPIENIDNGNVGFTSAKEALLSGLQSLVDWAKELANFGDMAEKLPIVAANVEIGVGTALEIAEALDQLRIKIKNYLDPLTTITTDDLLNAVGGAGGFTKTAIEHLDRAILGDTIFEGNLSLPSPKLTGSNYSFAIKINDGSTITINPSASNIPNILKDNINAAISGKSALAGKVQAVISEGRIAFQSTDPEFEKLEVKGLNDAVDILGFKGSFQSVVEDVLEGLGNLSVQVASGVTLDVDIVGGVPELRLNIDFDADRATAFNIDLGSEGSDAFGFGLNFDVSGTINMASHLDANLVLGLKLGTTPSFFLDVNDLGVTGEITTTTLGVNLDIGFLGASIANGSITMNVGLNVNFTSGSTGLIVSDLNPASIGSLISLSETSNSLSVFELPIKVKGGLSGFDAAVKAKILLESTPYTDLFSGDPLEIKIEDFNLTDGLDVDDLLNFNNTSVSGILSLIRQLANTLDDIGGSEMFSSFEIPFLDADLSDVLDFADMVMDALIYDDHDDDNDATGTPKLLDADNNPTFTNAQSFAQRLADILPLDLSGIAATYIPGTYDLLKYHIELSNTFASIDFPVDFNLDLSPLLDINSNLELTLNASGGLTLDIGLYLGDVPATLSLGSIDNTTLLSNLYEGEGIDIKTEPAVTAENSARAIYGRLTGDANFIITIGSTTYEVTVDAAATSSNTTVGDLVSNVTTALTNASVPGITATSVGNRIKLTAGSDFSVTVSFSSDPAVRELGFKAEHDAEEDGANYSLTTTKDVPTLVGRLSDDTTFSIIIGSTTTPVSILKADTAENRNIVDLVNDVNAALSDTSLSDRIEASSLGRRLVLTAVDPLISSFDLSASGAAVSDMGFKASDSSNNDDLIIHLSNGDVHRISLNTATTVGHVVNAINTSRDDGDSTGATEGDVTASASSGTRIILTDNTFLWHDTAKKDYPAPGQELFRTEPTNGSNAAIQLGLLRIDALEEEDRDGTIEGAALAGINPADRFFVENAVVKGNFDFSGAVDASATFGFVGISLTGTGQLNGEISAGLKRPEDSSAGGRLTLNEIIDNLGSITDIVASPTVTGKLAGGKLGKVDLTVNLEPDIVDIFISSLPTITINIDNIGNPFAENIFTSLLFVDADEFTVTGDYTNIFKGGLRISVESSPTITAEVLESSYDAGTTTTTVKLVSGVLTKFLSKITAPTPPSISAPGFADLTAYFDSILGDLAKFGEIDFDNIIAGLKKLLTFLSQFEQFDFLNQKIPLINKSVHDLMGFADKLSDAIDAAENSTTGTLQLLESALLDALGLSPVTSLFGLTDGLEYVNGTAFKLAGDVTEQFVEGFQIKIGSALSSVASTLYDSVSDKTTINLNDSIVPSSLAGLDIFVSKFLGFDNVADGLQRLADNKFKLDGDLRDTLALGSKIDFGSSIFSSIKNIVYDAVSNTTEVLLFDDVLTGPLSTLSNLDITPDFIDFAIESVGGVDILRINLMLVAGFTESLNVEIPDFLDLGALGGLVDLAGSANLSVSGSILANLDLGIGLDTGHLGQVFVYDTTGIEASLSAGGDNLAFRVALGPLGLNIIDGEASIEGFFSLKLDDSASIFTNHRAEITAIFSGNPLDNIDLVLDGSINVKLPTYFPRESNYIGDITLNVSPLSDYISDLSKIIDEFEYTDVLDAILDFDFSKFNIFDSILLTIDGIDMFLEGLQNVLDGEVFGFKLPIIGDALSGGADFIEDLRKDFIDPFRDLIEKAPDIAKDFVNPNKNVISDFLFDVLGAAGQGATGSALDLLIKENTSGDPLMSGGDFVSINGPGDIKLGGHTILDDYLFNPDTTYTKDDIYIEWDMHLGQSYNLGTGINFDLGIPGLGIETKGEINVTLTWDLDFGFGISFADGPYLIVDDPDELKLTIDVDLTGVSLTGKLAFLQLSATVVDDDFSASFAVNIKNEQDASDRNLSFTEIGSIGLEALLAANAYVDLDLALELNRDLVGSSVASGFPKLTSGFVFDWGFDLTSITDSSFGNAIAEGLKLVEFQDVSLDLGSFVNDVLGPIVSKIQTVTKPVQPLIDVFTTPFPVLDDFGLEITLLDLAAAYGTVNPDMIYAIADIITFINDIELGVDSIEITLLESFPVFDDGTSTHRTGSSVLEFDLWDADLDLSSTSIDSVFSQLEQGIKDLFGKNWFSNTLSSLAGEAADIMKDAVKTSSGSKGGFAFPIMEDPSQVIGLLMGRPAVLVTYDMPPLEFEFEWSQFFSIWGPLGVSINAEFGVTIDFAFGYDTLGIQQFVESDFRDFAALLNGFYVSDTDLATGDFGKDVPEVVINGGLWAAAEINLVIARAGVGGGVFFEIEFNLDDPDGDGRVRISEILGNIINQLKAPDIPDRFLAPIAMFDVSGRLYAQLFAFLKIDLFFFEINKRWDITPEIEILSFDIDFYRPPQLATVQKLEGTSFLQLNIGDFADRRLRGDTTDGDETISVSGDKNKLTVTGFGYTLDYEPEAGTFSKIFAIAGEGDDFIDLSGVTDPDIIFEIEGGAGNDIIKAGAGDAFIKGGSGDDKIWGGAGADQIYGGKGLDEIHGGGGNDLIFGDDGIISDKSVKVTVNISDSDDKIYGDAGKDILIGGGGNDTIEGGASKDIIIGDGGEILFTSDSVPKTVDNIAPGPDPLRAANPGITDIEKGAVGGNDILRGGAGDDLIFGGFGDDRLEGGGGADEIFGGTGFDTIYGGSEADIIFGDGWRVVKDNGGYKLLPTADGQADTIYGGLGGDEIYGGAGSDYIEGGGNSGEDLIYGGPGADILYGDSPDPADPYGIDIIYGEGGPDKIYGGGDNDTIDGGAGDDVIYGDYGEVDFKSGTTTTSKIDWTEQIYGRNIPNYDDLGTTYYYDLGTTKSFHYDEFNLNDGKAYVGRDTIYAGNGSDFVDGQGNYDTYIIKLEGADNDSRINIHDSGDSLEETDVMRVFGTVYDDEFLLRASVSLSGLAFVALINDDPYLERINYWSTERLVVEGSFGNDYFAVDDVRAETTIVGGIGEDLFQVGQMYRSKRNDDAQYANVDVDDIFATIETTRGWLSNGISQPMTINGGVGNDNFIVFHNKAVLTLNGEDGDDTFLIKAFALAGSQEPIRERTDVSGGAGADLIQYAMNAPVNIDGGDGFDTVIVIGTEFGDDFVITKDGVYGAGLNVNFVNIESLQVDGAEGDDRFYVLSTSEKFITEIAGGLGSDTFNMSGDTPPVISNDLRGHSGVITHSIETVDPLYEGIKIDGISANVADDDVTNVVVLTETGASTVVTEGSDTEWFKADWYHLVLSGEPAGDIIIQIYAPLQTEDQKELGSKAFKLWNADADSNNRISDDGTSLTLKFTTSDWFITQWVRVDAWGDVSDPLNYDDDAIEGTRNGVINHRVMNPTSIISSADSYSETTFPDETKGTILADTTQDFLAFDGDLKGMMVLITDGHGAGQSLRIKEYNLHTLTLYGEFSSDDLPDGSSTYIITKDIEAIRSINVEIYDNDAPGVRITQPGGSTDIHEGGATDTLQVVLTHLPTDDVKVTLSDDYGQLTITSTETDATNNTDGTVTLTFTSGNWNTYQTVTVTAKDDSVREGFHHGLITFTVDSVNNLDVDIDQPAIDNFTLATTDAYVGLSHKPVKGSVSVTVVGRPDQAYQVISNKVLFVNSDDEIEFLPDGTDITVNYSYYDPGYEALENKHGFEVKPLLTNIADNNVAQVWVRETYGSTDVIERETPPDSVPWIDAYEVLLTKEPASDVEVTVTPIDTKTSSGKVVYLDYKQVTVTSSAPGAVLNPDGTVTLTFTTSNWDTPQLVKVIAIDDTWGDGDDTQVFAPMLHTVGEIQGPLFIYGASGKGSLISFEPLMLSHELNIKPETGLVDSVGGDGTTVTVDKSDIDTLIADEIEGTPPSYLEFLVEGKRTLEITEGPALDQFRLIVDVQESGSSLILFMNKAFTLSGVTFDGSSSEAVFTGSNQLKVGTHKFVTGQSVTYSNGGGTDIGGLSNGNTYYVIVMNSTTVKLAISEANALAYTDTNNTAIDLTGVGSGDDHQLNERYEDIKKYAITRESPNFWAIEEEQIDYLFLNNEDSPADNIIDTRKGLLSDATTIGFDNNSTVEEFVTKMDGKRITGLGMGGDLYVGSVLQPGGITYGDLEVVEINLGRGIDHFTVQDTHSRTDGFQTWVIINTGDEPVEGDGDIVTVLSLGSDAQEIFAGTVEISTGATLDDSSKIFPTDGKGLVGFIVEITAGTGFGQSGVIVSNTEDGLTVASNWTTPLDTTSQYRIISTVLKSGETSAALLNEGTTLEQLGAGFTTDLVGHIIEITGGPGTGQKKEVIAVTDSEHLTVSSPWEISDDTTTANSRYRIYGEVDGPIAINTQGGDDEVIVDESTTSIPLVIFGGEGNDELEGGSADDIIFGDEGRVDYVAESGKIVTRLGAMRELVQPSQITSAGNDHANLLTPYYLTDTSVTFPTDDEGLKGLIVSITDGPDYRYLGQNRIIIGNTSDTLFLNEPWERVPDSSYKYRISLITEDQTDAVVREPSLILSLNHDVGGADEIIGNAGNDIILGGAGEDTIDGNTGDDTIFGDNGRLDFSHVRSDTPSLGEFAPTALDLIQTTHHGTGGVDTISGNEGIDIVMGGNDGDMLYGDDVSGTAGVADGGDIIIGDNGEVVYQQGVIAQIRTTDNVETTGGADTIKGNYGDDIIFGGVNGSPDIIEGNTGDDVILGDNGELDFAYDGDTDLTTLDLVSSKPYASDGTTVLGDADTISGNAGNDVVIGGTGGDTIYGDNTGADAGADDGEDILIGDNADIFLSGDVPGRLFILGSAVNRITTTDDEEASGGSDTIEGNAMADIILGGVGGDTVYGDRATPTTASTADDGDDVVLGDNGLLDFENGDADPQSLDVISSFTDGLGGADTISGNAGNDVVIGGSGGDVIYGNNDAATADDKDGEDTLVGDNADIIMSESTAGRLILGQAVYLIDTTDSTEGTGGADTISGNAKDDIIAGGVGGDTIYGDAGVEGDYDAVASPKVNDINDIILGDNGIFNFNMGDNDYTTLDLILTTDTGLGGADTIYGNDGDDYILGGKDGDTISGNADDDIILGDFGKIVLEGGIAKEIETIARTEGGVDTIYGNEDEDILIGGANGDNIDGDEADDLIFGDNVRIDRWTGLGDFTNPRFRALTGTIIYGEESAVNDGDSLVDTVDQNIPALTGTPEWGDWDITLYDHSFADELAGLNNFGDDYIAGGADDDTIFGQLGDDIIQGDGSIDGKINEQVSVGASRDSLGVLNVSPSFEDDSDGDDYIEGNGGNDVIFGNLGQDDILGGNSELFSLVTPDLRPDGTDVDDPDADNLGRRNDIIFGGAGTDVARNEVGDADIVDGVVVVHENGHSRDADMILGDNGNIFRLVGINGINSGSYLTFGYDNYSTALRIIPRAAELLDYHIGGPDYLPTAAQSENDIGAVDEIHGESGDDFIYGMVGSDILFGEGQDDDIIGGYGNDWISGGSGDDGVLGDDGRIYTSRNSNAGELLYGIAGFANNEMDKYIYTPGKIQQSTINVSGVLKKTVNLTPFKLGDPNDLDYSHKTFDPEYADDIIYGGWGNDFIHGGDGDDAISGAEALAEFYDVPSNPGDVLGFNYATGEFADYDEYDPWRKIVGFLLNFDSDDKNADNYQPTDPYHGKEYDPVMTDGDDVIFGDLGNDWLVGGTGRDHLYGGYGSDLMNVDDHLETNSGANDAPDTHPSYEDLAYGGAGRDVLIANTGGDRLIDWCGEFNSYIVPFAPFGMATVSRTLQPHLMEYLYDLSESDGADPTRAADAGADPLRNGEPEGELGLVKQKDFDWKDQTGAPDDPQAGNIPGGKRDVLRSATFNDGTMQAFFVDSGVWYVESGALRVSAESLGGDAMSVFHVDEMLPSYFEIQATITTDKPIAGWRANAYIIFDYYSPTDFKFAGLNASIDKMQMGHRTAEGWIVDVQTSMHIKPNRYYNMLVAVNGTTVTLLVNNTELFSHAFEPRIIDDWVYGLNSGMVGFGSDNSRGVFDNVTVQKLPPEITFEGTEDFSDAVADLDFIPADGIWNANSSRYEGMLAVGGNRAISLIDLGLGHGLEVASILIFEATLNVQTTGGLVFDYYGADSFKFAAISAESNQVIIGHFTAKRGWSIDAVFDITIEAGTDYDLAVSLKGTTVSVSVRESGQQNWQAMVGHVFNAVVVDGSFGLLSKDGSSSFDTLTVKTDDPAFRDESGLLVAASAPQSRGQQRSTQTQLTDAELTPIIQQAIEFWTESYLLDDSEITLLNSVEFQIVDFDGLALGYTSGTTIQIDLDAAGFGWFVDTTPADNNEFTLQSDGTLQADSSSPASGKMDLLTVVIHELGHVLGLDDSALNTESSDVMTPVLTAGTRRLTVELNQADDQELQFSDIEPDLEGPLNPVLEQTETSSKEKSKS